jgi:PD-(D/E)XK endonuclease
MGRKRVRGGGEDAAVGKRSLEDGKGAFRGMEKECTVMDPEIPPKQKKLGWGTRRVRRGGAVGKPNLEHGKGAVRGEEEECTVMDPEIPPKQKKLGWGTQRECGHREGGGVVAVGSVKADTKRRFRFARAGERSRKERGEIAETAFLWKAVSMGFGVAKPWGERGRYDFIVDTQERLWRVQVKSAHRASAEGEIDVLVAYVVPENAWYVVPIEAFQGFTSMKLLPSSKRRRSRYERYREAWCCMMCGWDNVEVRCGEGEGCPLRESDPNE